MRAVPLAAREPATDIAVDATLRAAASRRALCGTGGTVPFSVTREDLRKKVRLRPNTVLAVFVVDASESMETTERMAAAKGAVLALLTGAYQQRYRVGLVVFRGEEAQVLLEPTASIGLAQSHLRRLPTGGATPFADGLWKAWRVVQTERAKAPNVRPLLVILSDGQANIPLASHTDTMDELCALARAIREDHIHAVVIDTAPTISRSGGMRRLATAFGAAYHHIDRLRAAGIVEAVRASEGT